MTSNKTIGQSRWIVAAVALALMCTAVVCVSESASAADADQETVDVEETVGQLVTLFYGLAYAEPSGDAKVITGTYDLSASEQYSAVSIKGGAVINLSNSAVLTVTDLFIDGTVEIVNKDGSDSAIKATNIYFSNYSAFVSNIQVSTDDSITITSSAQQSGFFDPATSAFDPSKGIKGSASVDIGVDGTMTVVRQDVERIVFGTGGTSPAISMDISMDLTDTYNSAKDKLDGVPVEEIYAKLVDYMYNSFVYPDIEAGLSVAEMSGTFGKMKDVSLSLVSSKADKKVDVGMGIGSSAGMLDCTNLKAGFTFSLLKAKVTASADALGIERAVDGSDENQKVNIAKLNYEASTRGDKLIQVLVENYKPGDIQAMIDALAASDMELAGSVKLTADSIVGDGPVKVGEVLRNVKYDVSGLASSSDVNTKTGTTVSASADKFQYIMESGPIYSAVEGTLLKESFTTTGKNILGALKYLKVTPSADPEKRPDVKFDANGAVIDILNGANMKGELSLESMDVVNTITNSEKVFTQVHYSITGGTGTNFSTTYDAKFTTSAETQTISMTADLAPKFSDKAKLFVRQFASTEEGFDGEEYTLTDISLVLSPLTFNGTIEDIKNFDKFDMQIQAKAHMVDNSWSSGSGTTAYGESVDITAASYKTSLAEMKNAGASKNTITSGDALVLNSYKVADRGADIMIEFSDLVKKAGTVSTLKGTSVEVKNGQDGKIESLSMYDTVTVVDGKEVKYTEASKTAPVAHLVENAAGYYDVTTDSSVTSGPAVYNLGSKAAPAPAGGDDTMLYVAIAIIALVLIALAAYFLLKKRGSSS